MSHHDQGGMGSSMPFREPASFQGQGHLLRLTDFTVEGE